MPETGALLNSRADEFELLADMESPTTERIFRYWVELRDLRSGTTRNLPLGAIAKIHIPRKRNEAQRPREEILQLHGNSTIIEAKNQMTLRLNSERSTQTERTSVRCTESEIIKRKSGGRRP